MKNVLLFLILLILFWVGSFWLDHETIRRAVLPESVSVTWKDWVYYFLYSSPCIVFPFVMGLLHRKQQKFYFQVLLALNLFIGVFFAVGYTGTIWLYQHPDNLSIYVSLPRDIPLISFMGTITAFFAMAIPLVLGISVRQLNQKKFFEEK